MAERHSVDAGTSTQSSRPNQYPAVCGPQYLPWGAVKERSLFPENMQLKTDSKPGQYVMQVLFAEFTVMADRKIDQVLQHCLNNRENEKPLAKFLQRGEDPQFDQLLTSLNDVAEHCLPALLRALFDWYDKQNPTDELGNILHKHTKRNTGGSKDRLCEKRDLAVDFIYCLVLIEVLQQLPYHPGHDEHITHILSQCFKHFKYKEEVKNSPAVANYNMIADLYAEVLGVLSKSRFSAVKKRFMTELKELRSKDITQPFIVSSIISLLMGIKFFRVKMHPLEEFVQCITFLQDLGDFFLEKVNKEVRHALAGLFVEILLPVAGVVKNEVNVPVLKNFVEKMYIPTLDLSSKRKHSMALYPMVTCLLCVSQKGFFLEQWPSFLQQVLAKLRAETKMARVALESLYRLVWVYMIRIKCEGNTQTISRLQSIVTSLFPKGQKNIIIPKEAPLIIFVKIIQYIAQERLDFAMRDIIYDLLSVGKPNKIHSPERVSIGLRAFLLIADSLQQQEGEPPMPLTMGVTPSGYTLRYKKTFISKYLSEETARTIGVVSYYANVRKAFDAILRNLDSQVGKPLLQTKPENVNRPADELITGERKPKIDLFRTCLLAIPRLIPDGMNQYELIDLLARLTVHIDDELGKLAFQSLQNMMNDLPHWRNEVVLGYVQFMQREVTDMFPALLEVCTWRIISLLATWNSSEHTQRQHNKAKAKESKQERGAASPRDPKFTLAEGGETGSAKQTKAATLRQATSRATLHAVEGLALVLLCSCRPAIRKRAVTVLRDVRNMFTVLHISKDGEPNVLDIMDKSCPQIIEKVLPRLPDPEKADVYRCLVDSQWTDESTPHVLKMRLKPKASASHGAYRHYKYNKTAALQSTPIDFQWLADRTSVILLDLNESNNANSSTDTAPPESIGSFDPWVTCISVFMSPGFVMGHCHTAVSHAWPLLYSRLQGLWVHVDPQVTLEANRTSLLPSRGNKRPPSDRDMYMNLWKNYVVMGCCIVPPSSKADNRSMSPDLNLSSPEHEKSDHRSSTVSSATSEKLFKLLVPLIKCDVTDMRESVIMAIGHINPVTFRDLIDELGPLIKEAIEKRRGNREKIRRRDVLRLALARILHYMAENSVFASSHLDLLDPKTESLTPAFVEYIEGARQYLESEIEKDLQTLYDVRLHFTQFIRHLIRSMPVGKRKKFMNKTLRQNLFMLFASWSGKLGYPFVALEKKFSLSGRDSLIYTELELSAVQSMAAVVTCGPIWGSSPGLHEDSKIYVWLNNMLGSHHEKLYKLAQETIVWLLEFNPDTQCLLEWVIDRCYTATPEVADGCFLALARVFSHREYSCEHEAMLCLTLLHAGSPRIHVHETAVQLLHLLYKRFFLDDVIPKEAAEAVNEGTDEGTLLWHSNQMLSKSKLQEMLLSGPYSRSQYCLSETLARLHPEETMLIFSEITKRMNTATSAVRQSLLRLLVPWLHNMELCDPNLHNTNHPPESGVQYMDMKPPLKGEGWGSPEATQMVLNNLFFVSSRFGDDHPKELQDVWGAMVACWPDNMRCIIRYIIIITGMSPELILPHARRIIVYVGRAKPDRLVDEMMNELRTIEPLTFNVERTQTPPFYRLCVKRQQNSSDGQESSHDDSLSAVTDNTDVGSLHDSLMGSKPSSAAGSITSGHRLRLSQEYPDKLFAPSPITDSASRTGSALSIRSEASTTTTGATSTHDDDDAHTTTTQTSLSTAPQSTSEVTASPQLGTVGDGGKGSGTQQQAVSGPVSILKGASKAAESTPSPYPLPMPPYGGYFAPMHELLPSDTGSLPNPPYQRCNLAIMLLTDLVVDCIDIEWGVHLPLILHIVFLGMDNTRFLIHEHCKKLLLNLLLVLSAHNDHFSVAKIILGTKDMNEETALTLTATVHNRDSMFMETSYDSSTTAGSASPQHPSEGAMTPDSVDSLADVANYETTEQVAKALIEFLVTRRNHPLWSLEEITSKVHSIHSAKQLEHFLKYVLRIFKESLPLAHIEQRWGQEALHLALNCSSRHYAGRSFQVYRALAVPVTCRDLSEILARLEQTVAETDENMQGYVTEIFLTLEEAVDNLDVDIRPLLMKEIFMSTPNLNKDSLSQMRKSATITPVRQMGGGGGGATNHNSSGGHGGQGTLSLASGTSATPHGTHMRSTSYSPGNIAARSKNILSSPVLDKADDGSTTYRIQLRNPRRTRRIVSTPPDAEVRLSTLRGHHHSFSDADPSKKMDTNLKRSASSQSLKHDPSAHEDKVTILTQMFWVAVAMLESDYDYEFFLAVKLLTRIMKHIDPDNPEVSDKLEKILKHVHWNGFPGVQALLTKGCTNSLTAEPTWKLLSQFTTSLKSRVIAPEDSDGFPMNVMALLPYLVHQYEEPNEFCITAAERIAQECKDLDELQNLKHMMVLYSRGTFGKQSDQWTKCVVKYLYDAYVDSSEVLISFLVEVLDKGPAMIQGAVLQILHCIVSYYLEQDQLPMHNMNTDLLTIVAKFIESSHWKECMKILKLCVSKSSALTAAPNNFNASAADNFNYSFQFSDPEAAKKQLPGRTMEFKFNMAQISVIGHKRLDLPNHELEESERVKAESTAEGFTTSWEKPRLCQEHVRQRLHSLLDYYDPTPRAHKLQNSSSVTFPFEDSPGNTLERQFSVNNTSNPSDGGSVVDTQTGTDPSETITGDDSSVNKALQSFHFLEEEEYELTGGFSFGVMSYDSGGSLDRKVDAAEGEGESESDTDDETETGFLPELTTMTLENPQLDSERTRSRNPSGSTQYSGVAVTDTEDELPDMSPSNASPIYEDLHLPRQPSEVDEVEEDWKHHVSEVMRANSAEHAVNTFHIFTHLFQDTSAKLSALTTESCILLKRPPYIQEISGQISHMLELLISKLICPFVFVDIEALVTIEFLERHKICYAEIEQTYDTYTKKRREAIECLNHVRAVSRTHSAAAEAHPDPIDRMKMLLCERLYGLHFQFLQLFDSYIKLVKKLLAKHPQVTDLSKDAEHLKQELRKSQSHLDIEQGAVGGVVPAYDVASMSQSEAEQQIMDLLVNKRNFDGALHAVSHFKSLLLDEVHFSDDVDVVLYVYCKKQAEHKSGVLAVTDVTFDLSGVNQCLTSVYTALKQGDQALRSVELQDGAGSVVTRTTDFSIL